jgi:hypothetical protein
MNEAAEKLVDAVNSVQSWEDTWVGECIQYIDDLRYQPLPSAPYQPHGGSVATPPDQPTK